MVMQGIYWQSEALTLGRSISGHTVTKIAWSSYNADEIKILRKYGEPITSTCRKFIFTVLWAYAPISVGVRSKAWVCSRSLARIVGSNPAGGKDVCVESCVLSDRGLCDGSITRPEESYRLWCVVVCDLETSRMRRSWPALGWSATGQREKRSYVKCFTSLFHKHMYFTASVYSYFRGLKPKNNSRSGQKSNNLFRHCTDL